MCEIGPIKDMLESFSVGTYCWKDSPGPPLPASVRPLHECKFITLVRMEKDAITKHNKSSKLSDVTIEHRKSIVGDKNTDLNQHDIKSACTIDALNIIVIEKFTLLW